MADGITIQVEGLTDLLKDLKRIGDKEVVAAVKAANRKASEAIVAAALPNVPVGPTGRLKASTKASAGAMSARMVSGKGVPYALAVHWGTGPRPGKRGPHNIRRNPYLWNAREELAERLLVEWKADIAAALAKYESGPTAKYESGPT